MKKPKKARRSLGPFEILAVLVIAGLVVLVAVQALQVTNGKSGSRPAAITASPRQDCTLTSARPCIDRQTGRIIVGLEPRGGEKAFEVCLKNKFPGSSGSLTAQTSRCSQERFLYCYEGKSKIFLRKFEGLCGEPPAEPQPTPACQNAPEYVPLSFLDPTWSMKDPIINYFIRSMLEAGSGTLFAAGITIYYNEYYGGYIPVLHRSTDNGVTWNSVALPYDATTGWNMVYSMVEDRNEVIYAGGTKLWKSIDDGKTWTASNLPSQPSSYWGGYGDITSLAVGNDNSLIAVITTPDYEYSLPTRTEVYTSADGGVSWQRLFTYDMYIVAIVQANDGALVFRDYAGAIRGSAAYRYADGRITQTFTDHVLGTDFYSGLHKSGDGTLYMISTDTSVDIYSDEIDYTKPGAAFSAAYKSTDNGITWAKLGSLPDSWSSLSRIIESADGTLYVATHSTCDGGGAIYKSTDRGKTWSIMAYPPKFGTGKFGTGREPNYYYFTALSILEVSEKILISGTAPVIFSTP